MQLVQSSLAFQHNSRASASPILILRILQAFGKFSIQMAGTRSDQGSIYMFLQLLRPCSHGPSFWSTQLPYLLLYRSSVLRHPTLLSRGMTGAKPLSLKTKPPHLFSIPRKANKLQNWTAHGPTGQRETCFECLNKQNTDC